MKGAQGWSASGSTSGGIPKSHQAALSSYTRSKQFSCHTQLTDVRSLAGSGIHCDDHTSLEDEAQCGGPMRGLHVLDHLPFEGVDLRNERNNIDR